MIDLLLPLRNQDYRYVLTTGDKVFLVQQHSALENNEIERDTLDVILQESFSFEKSKVRKMVLDHKYKRLTLYTIENDERNITLDFASHKALMHFIQAIPNAKEEVNQQSNTMPVLIGIWLLLTVYAFIWAGTRESPEDVNPYGIRLRIAYFAALLMQKLVMAIGQSFTLWIGIILLAGYSWLIYVQYLKGPDTIVYHVQPNTEHQQ